jgi:hypothetical protein
MITKILAGTAGMAALAAAAPAAAQYYPYGYSYNAYSYSPYRYGTYGTYGTYGVGANVAEQQCTAAVPSRLYNRTSLASILGSLVGLPTNSYGRVTGITSATPTRYGMRVRGVASSGRYAYNSYGPYGVGAYGALGYNYANAADLSWRCDVDARGYVRDVDINRRY